MRVNFPFKDFDIRDKEAVNVTKRIGKFVVNQNESDFLRRFKEALNQQQDFEHKNIDELMAKLLNGYIQWSDSETKNSQERLSMTDKALQLITILQNEVECSLAIKFNKEDCWCYTQIRSGSENWEILFEMNKHDKNVDAFELYQYFDANINMYSDILFQSWMSYLPQTKTAHKGNASSLMVGKDEKSNVFSDDDGGGFSRVQDNEVPIVYEEPAYMPLFENMHLDYLFWQSWAQWIFMFQDHTLKHDQLKDPFMEKFMNLVAKELFNIEGQVVHVKRHKTRHEIKGIVNHELFYNRDHIVAHHPEGKIFILYKNLPHGESIKDYNNLITETGNYQDTMFLYTGKMADLDGFQQYDSINDAIQDFYTSTTPEPSSGPQAAATGKGNAGTENLMVDGSDEEDKDGKSEEDGMKDIVKRFKELEAKNVLKKHAKAAIARKELEKKTKVARSIQRIFRGSQGRKQTNFEEID